MEESYSESDTSYSVITYPKMDHCSSDNHSSIHRLNNSSNIKYAISNCVHISKILQRKNTRSCAQRCSVIVQLMKLIVLSLFLSQTCTVRPASARSMVTVFSPDFEHNQLASMNNHNSNVAVSSDGENFMGASSRSQALSSNPDSTSDVSARYVLPSTQGLTSDVFNVRPSNVVSPTDVQQTDSTDVHPSSRGNDILSKNIFQNDAKHYDLLSSNNRQENISLNSNRQKNLSSVNIRHDELSSVDAQYNDLSPNDVRETDALVREVRETSHKFREKFTSYHNIRGNKGSRHTSRDSDDSISDVRENDHASSLEDEGRGLPLWGLQEQEVLKRRILDGLGMDSAPPRHIYNVTKEEYDAAYSEYLRAVAMEEEREEELAEARYRRLYPDEVDDDLEEDEVLDSGPDEDGEDSSALAEYKFFSTRITRPSRGRGRRSLPNGDRIAHFHVSVPMSADDIQVVWAKATFFKKGNADPGPDDPKTVSMQLYRVDDIKKFRSKRKTGGPGKDELLQTFNLTVTDDETLEVNMTEAVKSWLESSESDTGVLIRCPDCLSAGVQIRTGGTSHVPTLHVQTRLSATKRVKRSRDMRRATRAKWRQLGDCKDGRENGRHSSRCCRRSMTVRFDDLPGFDFIAAPKDFDAYYCSGKCPPRYNPANEHALLQSLINMQKKKDVPRPCCAPTDLKGLYILHYDHTGKLKTELWRDVIVTECGCT